MSTALHVSIACALDPSVDSAFGVFPLADAIDIWARDPPEISSLGLSGETWVGGVVWCVAFCVFPFFLCFSPDGIGLRAQKRKKKKKRKRRKKKKEEEEKKESKSLRSRKFKNAAK